MNRILPFLVILTALTACGKDSKSPITPDSPPPADEATPEQHALIDATLAKIESTSADLGRSRKFRSVPVIVSSDSRYVKEAKGACVRSNGKARFILVRPAVLDFESRLPPDAPSTTLFPVLLHEIGHCYYHRGHDAALIRSNDEEIAMALRPGSDAPEEHIDSLDASVMSPEKLLMPVVLQRYYVAEILGLVRERNLEAVGKFTTARGFVKFVKRKKSDDSAGVGASGGPQTETVLSN